MPEEQPVTIPGPLRGAAQSFGVDAARYDRARPHYPAELVQWVLDQAPGRDVLDIGVGTGIVARQFQRAGCRVLGVDPDERMAAAARTRGCPVEVARIEEWEPAGRAFDAAVAGQTWHWVDPVAGAAKVAQVLRPRGVLALFWNVFDLDEDLSQAFAQIQARAVPESPALAASGPRLPGYVTMCETAEKGMAQCGAFGPPQRWSLQWDQPTTRDQWLDQLPTQGIFTRLEPHRLRTLLQETGDAIDAVGGSFTIRYTTLATAAERLA